MCTLKANIYETLKVFLGGVGMTGHTEGGAGNLWDLATYISTQSKRTHCSSDDKVVKDILGNT